MHRPAITGGPKHSETLTARNIATLNWSCNCTPIRPLAGCGITSVEMYAGGPPLLLACIDPPCGSPHRRRPQSIRIPGQIKRSTGCQRAKAAGRHLSYLAVDIGGAVKDNLYLSLHFPTEPGIAVDSYEQHGQDADQACGLPVGRAPAERVLGPRKTAIFLCVLIFFSGFAFSQSHLKRGLNETKRPSVLIELAGLANSFEANAPPTPGNLSAAASRRTPPPSFAFSDRLPLYLVENRGQVDNHNVSHYAQGRDRTIYFTPDGLTFALLGEHDAASKVQGLAPHTNARSLPASTSARQPAAGW